MKSFYRSVWISDAHLCSKDARAEMLYSFLDSVKVDYLYLVGDIIDLWALRNKWHWPMQYNEVLHKVLKRSRKGARVIYIPGNHDEFFRHYEGYHFGAVEIQLNAVHETADGRRFLVIHGDEFDSIIRYKPWLSHLGCWAYARLHALNRAINTVRRIARRPPWSLSAAVARRVQRAVRHLADFEELAVREARRHHVDGVICGHTHQPAMRDFDGVLYCNTGDWINHCTALVETESGELALVWWEKELMERGIPVPGRKESMRGTFPRADGPRGGIDGPRLSGH